MLSGAFALSAREARRHAVVVAVVTWTVAIAVVGIGRSDVSIFGPLKWSDFVHMYALGAAARLDRPELLYDAAGLHDLQAALVPASGDVRYLTTYSPQTSLAFAPLSALPYWWAGLTWAGLSLAIYGCALGLAGRHAGPDRATVVIAALAFPPASQLVLHGQTTPFVLAGFVLAALALARGRPVLAGVAWSLLWIKPQFGIGLAAVMLLSREWRIIAGAVLGSAAQFALVLWWWDLSVLRAYAEAVAALPAAQHLLEPAAYKLHSVAALTKLLGPAHWPTLAATSALIAWRAARVWRSSRPLTFRFAVLALAAFLVNPHVSIYDGVLLACVALWLFPHTELWRWAYAVGAVLLLPTAALVGVQASAILLCVLLWRLSAEQPQQERRSADAARMTDTAAVAS